MCGSTPPSATSLIPRNCATVNRRSGARGRNGGKTRTPGSSTSSVRTTSCSIASSSRQCSRPTAAISCPTMCRPTSFSTLRTTKFPPRATGPCGCTNTCTNCRASRMCCAMCSRPTPRRPKTTTSLGRTFRSATTPNSWPSMETSSTVLCNSPRNTGTAWCRPAANC